MDHKNQMLQNGRQVLQLLEIALACVVAYLPVLAVIPNRNVSKNLIMIDQHIFISCFPSFFKKEKIAENMPFYI